MSRCTGFYFSHKILDDKNLGYCSTLDVKNRLNTQNIDQEPYNGQRSIRNHVGI